MLARKVATYADLQAVPSHYVAEIIEGVLETHPRPAPRHARAASRMGLSIGNPFELGLQGPGGWIIIDEPEIHLGPHIVVPDLAGWRSERLAVIPERAYFETIPDWVCEIISPSTSRLDRGPKRRIYAEYGVQYLWLLDPDEQVLEAFHLIDGQWTLVGTVTGSGSVSLPPFDAISFPLSILFPFDAPKSDEPGIGS
jgi:Uma2 family endonuclease